MRGNEWMKSLPVPHPCKIHQEDDKYWNWPFVAFELAFTDPTVLLEDQSYQFTQIIKLIFVHNFKKGSGQLFVFHGLISSWSQTRGCQSENPSSNIIHAVFLFDSAEIILPASRCCISKQESVFSVHERIFLWTEMSLVWIWNDGTTGTSFSLLG